MSYNVGTRGYATGGSGGRESYGVGKGYSLKVGDDYSKLRSGIYDGPRGTGMQYGPPSDVMKGLKEIVFAPKMNTGRGLR